MNNKVLKPSAGIGEGVYIMIKTLGAQIKEFKKSIDSDACIYGFWKFHGDGDSALMASIIDDGVNAGNIRQVFT